MDSKILALITAGAAIIAALGALGSLTKACGTAWRGANTSTTEWPICQGCFLIPSIRTTARALTEVVIFRTRCGRSAREEGIPQGIQERSIRGSIGVGGSREYP